MKYFISNGRFKYAGFLNYKFMGFLGPPYTGGFKYYFSLREIRILYIQSKINSNLLGNNQKINHSNLRYSL